MGVIGLLALSSLPADAACTTDGSTATCTGSDLGPISYSEADGIDAIIVQDLTGDVDGTSGTAISLSESGTDGSNDGDDGAAAFGANVKVTGTNGSDTYGITGSTTTSVSATSTGGAGAEGEKKSGASSHTGGSGGEGGEAGAATFTMTGGFIDQTEGDRGILVSSIGGAGGKGGEATVTGGSHTYDADGGNGGDGAAAGTATLTLDSLSGSGNAAGVTLSGLTVGISVSSIGGEGGEGGEAFCDSGNVEGGCKGHTGVGGNGAAADMARMSVSNTDVSITDVAIGVEVLSIGGTGGRGGLGKAVGGLVDNRIDNTPTNGYGNGGDGGEASTALLELDSGSTVNVTDSTATATYGVVVSSIGGAGGDGNDSAAKNEFDARHPGYGNGGAGGGGESAKLTLSGSELTVSLTADDAVSVLISSQGGNGGSAGKAINGFSDSPPDGGGNGGVGGNGGTATIAMDSGSVIYVTTTGADDSMGALTLLSQGGDGGNGGNDGNAGNNGKGDGADGGDGGSVTGTMTTVHATTSGDDAFGILLKNAGGAGGTGAASDGSGGDGGTIDVTISTVSATTTGSGSHGVYALSTGGAGGDMSSGGNGGNGSMVTLDVGGGTVSVSGDNAYGIAAVSSVGSAGSGDAGDTTGAVTLTTGAAVTVTASGSGGVGLYVESSGATTNGALSVTVDSGGSVTASGDAAAAVSFVNGDTNTLTNNGTITTDDVTSSSIYAVTATGAALTATNNDTFSGSVDLDDGYANSFINASGATASLGASMDLGTSGSFSNSGTVSPGGENTVLTSTITGAFNQTSDGTYLVDLDGSSTDEMIFETYGKDTLLEGTVEVNAISTSSTSGSSDIARSEDAGITIFGLTVSDTATIDYSLDTSDSQKVTLDWDVDMAGAAALGSANGNQTAVASHMQSLLENGGTIDGDFGGLLNLTDVDELVTALDSFASQIAADVQLSQLFSAQQFSDALLSCSVRDGVYRFVDQDQCAWLRAGGSGLERSATGTSRGFDQTAWQFAGGGQFEVRDNWFIGTGFSIETQSLSVDDIASADGNIYQGGIVAKHTMGNTMLSASLSGGYGDFDVTRYLFSTDIAQGNETLWTVSGQISASHAFVAGDWYLKPRVDLGFDHVAMNGFTESGAGGASLNVLANGQTWYSIQPAVEFGGEIKAGNGVLIRPNLTVGLTQFLGDAAPSTSASFANTPAGVAPFTVTSDFDKTYFDVKAGFEVLATDRISVTAQGFGQFSENITSYGGSAKLGIRF